MSYDEGEKWIARPTASGSNAVMQINEQDQYEPRSGDDGAQLRITRKIMPVTLVNESGEIIRVLEVLNNGNTFAFLTLEHG